jgi:lipid II:glycine glycyltransferase (peptidoglycan interpeptide bridge formation enzyme)
MYAIDRESNIHAAIFVVWDHESAYYLLGGGDTDYRNSGATSLLLYNAIKKVSAKVDRFDFEGSMMEPIERFVRGFGSKQIELKVISKSTSKRFFMIQTLKEFKKLF